MCHLSIPPLLMLYQIVSHSKDIPYHFLSFPDVSVFFIGKSSLHRQLCQKISKTFKIFQMPRFEMRKKAVNIVSIIKIVGKNRATFTPMLLGR